VKCDREEGKRAERERGAYGWGEKWECTKKISHKTQPIWHFGTPLGEYCFVSYIFRKVFSGTTLPSQIR